MKHRVSRISEALENNSEASIVEVVETSFTAIFDVLDDPGINRSIPLMAIR